MMQTKVAAESLDGPLAHRRDVWSGALEVDPASVDAPSQHFNCHHRPFHLPHALFLAASRAAHTSCYEPSMSPPV